MRASAKQWKESDSNDQMSIVTNGIHSVYAGAGKIKKPRFFTYRFCVIKAFSPKARSS